MISEFINGCVLPSRVLSWTHTQEWNFGLSGVLQETKTQICAWGNLAPGRNWVDVRSLAVNKYMTNSAGIGWKVSVTCANRGVGYPQCRESWGILLPGTDAQGLRQGQCLIHRCQQQGGESGMETLTMVWWAERYNGVAAAYSLTLPVVVVLLFFQ